MLCEICHENASKYKCSKCHSPYCSLNCWKKHSTENECKVKKVDDQSNLNNNDTEKTKYFTEDTVKDEKLRLLGEDKKLKSLLKNPYLRNTIRAVDNSSDPEEAIKQAMKDPEFVEFVDECLRVVEDPND